MNVRSRAQRWAAWLSVSLVLTACSGAATPAPTAAPTGAPTTAATAAASPTADAMKALEEAAIKEGTVVIAGPQGASYAPALTKAFAAKYPGIKIELTQS